jgi:hypothetical protein
MSEHKFTWLIGYCKECDSAVFSRNPDKRLYPDTSYHYFCTNSDCEHSEGEPRSIGLPDWVRLK